MTRKKKKILLVVAIVLGVFLFVGYTVRNMFSDIFGGVATNGFGEIFRNALTIKNKT